jgi:hypothetical protein
VSSTALASLAGDHNVSQPDVHQAVLQGHLTNPTKLVPSRTTHPAKAVMVDQFVPAPLRFVIDPGLEGASACRAFTSALAKSARATTGNSHQATLSRAPGSPGEQVLVGLGGGGLAAEAVTGQAAVVVAAARGYQAEIVSQGEQPGPFGL